QEQEGVGVEEQLHRGGILAQALRDPVQRRGPAPRSSGMEGNRGSRGRALPCALVWVVAMLAGLVVPGPAAAATQVRTLFLTEQVRPGAVRGPLAGPVQPQHVVAQPGEEEGFLLAVRPASTLHLEAVVDPASSEFARQWTQVLRSEWVTVTRP